MFCREQAAEFRAQEKNLEAEGARLVFVGMGIPPMADDFRMRMKIAAPVWVDTERVLYRQLELSFGASKVVGLKVLRNSLRALSKGQLQGRTRGNPLQNGGIFVVAKGGRCTWSFVEQVAGDRPEMGDVFGAVRSQPAA